MRHSIGKYVLDIDVARTRAYYENAGRITCDCIGCRNYELAVEHLPGNIKDFFEILGIDIRKPAEISVNCKRRDGNLFYSGFYHICGTIEEGKNTLIQVSENVFHFDQAYFCSLADKFQISFQQECYLVDEYFPRPVFQMEIFADIPWVLPGVECDYVEE